MKYRKRGFFQRIVYAVGLMVSVGFIALVSITCVGIKIKAEKEGITFKQACAKVFFGEPRPPVETYSGSERPALPSLEEVAEKQASNSHPAAPRQLTPGNGTAQPAKPVVYSAPSKKQTTANGDEAGVCESCKRFHLKSVTCASDEAFASTLVKEPTKPKYKQPARAKKSKKPAFIAAAVRPLTAKEIEEQKLWLLMKQETAAVMNGTKEPKKNTPKANAGTGMAASFKFLGNVFKDY